jgi:cytochrome c biogenesis protein
MTLRPAASRHQRRERRYRHRREGTDVRKVDLTRSLNKHLGSGAKGGDGQQLRNVGPSVSYKLRDASGQAREFNNYMLPVEVDGRKCSGRRARRCQRAVPLPAHPRRRAGQPGWQRLKSALHDGALREEAARRYVADRADLLPQLAAADGDARKALDLFAGIDPDSRTRLAG